MLDKETRLKNLIETKATIKNPDVTREIDKIILKDQLAGSLTDEELQLLLDSVDSGKAEETETNDFLDNANEIESQDDSQLNNENNETSEEI